MLTTPKMVFFHIAWMQHYCKSDGSDPAIGPHRHLKNNGQAHECFNFLPRNGRCYGYFPGDRGIVISKLGAPKQAKHVDNVVCVWVAEHPEQKMKLIVGWYRNARVYRTRNHEAEPSGNQLNGKDIQYSTVTFEDHCTLVPAPRRTFEIPTRPGGLGRSNVWYGGNDRFREKVRDYINRWDEQVRLRQGGRIRDRKSGGRRNADPERRKQAETIAVNKAIEFYSSANGGGYEVVSKESEALGWDLEASRPGCATLLIEVKGRSGSELVVELTPNEYSKMTSTEHRSNYVLFVVTDCSREHPVFHQFRFREGSWSDLDGTILKIEERTGAVCRA
ncbi:MAG: DUF3883 domain-containing protein [Candidatus Dadabacteria bacterium]|nr:DUF3883 domain-containing protein [Candidatus Dadabacteria bacterium]